jgi:hypothetical protein
MDDFTLKGWQWAAEDELVTRAWSITGKLGLDPQYAERVQRGAAEDDREALVAAVADLLEAVSEASKP